MASNSKTTGRRRMSPSTGCSGTTDQGCTPPSAISAQLSLNSKRTLENSPSEPDREGPTATGRKSKTSTLMRDAFGGQGHPSMDVDPMGAVIISLKQTNFRWTYLEQLQNNHRGWINVLENGLADDKFSP